MKSSKVSSRFYPIFPNTLFLYHLKTSENLKVFWWFQGVEKRSIGNRWINTGKCQKQYEHSRGKSYLHNINEIIQIQKKGYHQDSHWVNNVRIRSSSGQYFPVFRLDSIQMRENTDTFHVVTRAQILPIQHLFLKHASQFLRQSKFSFTLDAINPQTSHLQKKQRHSNYWCIENRFSKN